MWFRITVFFFSRKIITLKIRVCESKKTATWNFAFVALRIEHSWNSQLIHLEWFHVKYAKNGTLSNTVHCALFLLQRNKNSGWFTNRRELSTTWTEYTYHVSIFIHWIEFHIIILRNSYLFARENEKLELCQLNFWIMHEWKMFASSANQPVISTKESTHK